MSDPTPASTIFSTRYKYFLNKEVASNSVVLAATSIDSGNTATFSLSIPIDDPENYSQIRLNFSHDPNNWYVFPIFDIVLDANFNIAVVGSYDSNSLDLAFYVINQTGGTETSTATTVTASVYLFETPE